MNDALTIPQLIKANHLKWSTKTAICVKKRGIWHQFSWKEYYEKIKYFSLGLISLGLKRGDVVCIIGDNEPEWFWGEFAVQAAGGIATGAFVDSIPSELKYIAGHSGASFAIVNDQEQADKFLEICDELPALRKVVFWDAKGLNNYDHPLLISFEKVMEEGQAFDSANPGRFEENIAQGQPDDTAFIYYTSGTTGLPKGAILTHRALIQTARGFTSVYPLFKEDNLVSNFPAAWVGDSYFATIPHILTGARLNFAEEPETIAEDTREVGPDFAIYGPRQWESLVSEIQVKMTDAHPLKRFFYHMLLPVGYKIADLNFQNKKPNVFWNVLHSVAYYLLLRPLKDRLGLSKVRFAVTGSSVLSLDTFRLIHAIGIELRQTYASTEAGFISSHTNGEIDFQSVGRPALGVEVRIALDGELLVRSDCLFKEYLNEPEKTKAVKIKGWCHTGDAVNINDSGHLIFLDRLEHMVTLVTGARYAPQYIEGRLRFSPYIKDAMVIGGKDKAFVSAMVNIDFAMVGKWAERKGITYTTFVDLSQKEEVANLIKKDLSRVNSYLPELSRVKRYMLMHKEFDPDEAELTRTRKLRREFMEMRYKPLIEAIYNGQNSMNVDASVTYRDGRKGMVSTGIKIWDL
ncbi:MAG: AMP-binding protein [Dehalococcoidia bacterium]|nr:AMP-binding protein [Dehalococcoidia bacterium]MDD5493084.1 AMP-binding protein [Dehalococcoidia bacterium]